MDLFTMAVPQFKRFVAAPTLLLFMATFASPLVRAQSDASLTGTVNDVSGAGMPGATITIKN